jgi:histone H2B
MAKRQSGGKKGGKRSRKGKRSFNTYISRLNKASGRKLTLSSKAVKILNSFANHQFDRIATEAAAIARANKRSTIRAAEIQTAVRVSFPADLAKHSISEASKAVTSASK